MRMYDLIMKKRNGEALNHQEIQYLVEEYVAGNIPDYQMSAFLMAVYFQGMTEEEKKEIQEKLDHPEGKREGGIGLSNVANRIYHFFGREAQIRVESEPDQGTKFILTLPYPKNREIMLKEENEESEDEWNEIY